MAYFDLIPDDLEGYDLLGFNHKQLDSLTLDKCGLKAKHADTVKVICKFFNNPIHVSLQENEFDDAYEFEGV